MAGRTIPESEGGKSGLARATRWVGVAFQVTLMIHLVGCLPTSRRSPIRVWPAGP